MQRQIDGRVLLWLMAPLLLAWWAVISELAAVLWLGMVVVELLQTRDGEARFEWPRWPLSRKWYLLPNAV